MHNCHYCEKPESDELEMRPYGPGGSWICHPCGTAPENEASTRAAFITLLDATAEISPGKTVVIGGREGPVPFNPEGEK